MILKHGVQCYYVVIFRRLEKEGTFKNYTSLLWENNSPSGGGVLLGIAYVWLQRENVLLLI